MNWLFDSIIFMDFDKKVLLSEAYTIGQYSYGAISLESLISMDFDDYQEVVRITQELNRKEQATAEND